MVYTWLIADKSYVILGGGGRIDFSWSGGKYEKLRHKFFFHPLTPLKTSKKTLGEENDVQMWGGGSRKYTPLLTD